jgi:cell wall-associated NlpC family hydrolase
MKKLKIEPMRIAGLSERKCEKIESFLEEELLSWKDTPYVPGQCVPNRGIDCVHLITAIYDVMTGQLHQVDLLPQDASFHNKASAESGLRKFFRLYPSHAVSGSVVQPGDVIICGPVGKNGGPGHGMIVGKDSLWHVDGKCVCKAGLAVMQHGAYAFRQIRRLKYRKKVLGGLYCGFR